MNPSTIINKLAEEITLENVLKTIGSDNKDPLQPIMDIVHSSVIRYDYSTLTECFNIMDYKLNEILEIKSLNKEKKGSYFKSCHISLWKSGYFNRK